MIKTTNPKTESHSVCFATIEFILSNIKKNMKKCSKKKLTVATALFLSFISILSSASAQGLGSEAVNAVQLVTSGVKSFLTSVAGPYMLILIIAFFAILIVGVFGYAKQIMGG